MFRRWHGLCGDALDDAAYERLLDGQMAEFVLSDPPYNVPIDGHVCGKGAIRYREFAIKRRTGVDRSWRKPDSLSPVCCSRSRGSE